VIIHQPEPVDTFVLQTKQTTCRCRRIREHERGSSPPATTTNDAQTSHSTSAIRLHNGPIEIQHSIRQDPQLHDSVRWHRALHPADDGATSTLPFHLLTALRRARWQYNTTAHVSGSYVVGRWARVVRSFSYSDLDGLASDENRQFGYALQLYNCKFVGGLSKLLGRYAADELGALKVSVTLRCGLVRPTGSCCWIIQAHRARQLPDLHTARRATRLGDEQPRTFQSMGRWHSLLGQDVYGKSARLTRTE